MVEVAESEDGSGWRLPAMGPGLNSHAQGTVIYDVRDTWATVKGGSTGLSRLTTGPGPGDEAGTSRPGPRRGLRSSRHADE